ncbi:contractile injection system protein, VgrG/Pvc8 family [Endozoicomonas euniceicola]|uniref:Contractile injection system protein, VgrG/Pvc8 family n=1 Tax=Endozoicomonas euniceicola TaxID=1234143 RepID=A0ABY6GNE2_9GAMM|nr:contractile injection system protein, VgrG/Pvc8 family [Endozoicomonas euniceicola]UYM14245.1 contractile injection system protein, VgrG/Pvc8 family [Endozoicomonas euniceicola]
MGLSTGIQPVYRITANEQDITDAVSENLISLNLTDEAGIQSDSLTIQLHDAAPGYSLPGTGAKLEVWLGYDSHVQNMGLFIVNELELSGPPSTMTIKAQAAPLSPASDTFGQIQTQKNRSWENITIGDLVKTIAEEQKMTPVVGDTLTDIKLEHIDQTSESDINLLTRIAKDHNAMVKPVSGRLLFMEKGRGKTATGKEIPPVIIKPEDLTSWKVRIAERSKYQSVTTRWQDIGSGEEKTVTAGEGKPELKITHNYADQPAAEAAAKSRYESMQRGASRLSLTLPGSPDLKAETVLKLVGFRTAVDGDWVVSRVTHKLDKGYVCSVEGEVPKG